MKRIVFIDRDGVINVDPIGDYIKSWKEFKFEKGVLKALKEISGLGIEIIIISNQAGVGDGVYPESALWDVHKKMMREFNRNKIRILSTHYCLHGKQAGCKCRKPETGLFEDAVRNLEYDPRKTFFVGDKATDIEAGKRFGLKTIYVMTGHGPMDRSKLTGNLIPDHIVNSLEDVPPLLAL